jgi:rhamnosyltransferase subunit B
MQLTEATKSFIQAGAPPVVFTAGSAMAQSAEHFRCAVEAVRGQEMRAILVSKFKDQIPDNLPPNVYHATYEPFDQLCPLAAAVQHHGGIGTSIQCLTAGKPQLVVPFAHDQFDNALRLQKLQVAQTSRANQPVEWRRKLQYLTSHADVAQACAATRELILADHDFQARVARAILD